MSMAFLTRPAGWHFAWIVLLAAGATWMLMDAAAEQFKKDHYGTRILTADEIAIEVLREIAGKPSGSPQ